MASAAGAIPTGNAVIKGVVVTIVALGVWEMCGRDAVMKLKS